MFYRNDILVGRSGRRSLRARARWQGSHASRPGLPDRVTGCHSRLSWRGIIQTGAPFGHTLRCFHFYGSPRVRRWGMYARIASSPSGEGLGVVRVIPPEMKKPGRDTSVSAPGAVHPAEVCNRTPCPAVSMRSPEPIVVSRARNVPNGAAWFFSDDGQSAVDTFRGIFQ